MAVTMAFGVSTLVAGTLVRKHLSLGCCRLLYKLIVLRLHGRSGSRHYQVEPLQGSTAGGTELHIAGAGFAYVSAVPWPGKTESVEVQGWK